MRVDGEPRARGIYSPLPQWWGAVCPLDMAADQPAMWRFATKMGARQARAWEVDVEVLTYVWGFRAAGRTADPETGRVRTQEWDLDSPMPSWAAELVLVILGPAYHANRTAPGRVTG